jgi:DME family drug/metabolite transporter
VAASGTASGRGSAIAAVVVASVLFGTTGTALQKGPSSATALGAGSARLLLGSVTLAVVARCTGLRRVAWRLHWRSALLGGSMVALYQLSFFQATRRAGVAVATVCTIASGPVFAALIDWSRSHGRGRTSLGRAWWVGTLTCIVGVFLIVSPGDGQRYAIGGVAAALISGFGYAAYATAAKHQMERGLDPAGSMASLFVVGAVLTAPLLIVEPMRWLASARGIVVIVHLGVVTVGLAYTLYGRGLRRLETPTVVTLTLVEPITAAVLSVVVLRESLRLVNWAGVLIVLGGLVVATRPGTVRAAPTATRGAQSKDARRT